MRRLLIWLMSTVLIHAGSSQVLNEPKNPTRAEGATTTGNPPTTTPSIMDAASAALSQVAAAASSAASKVAAAATSAFYSTLSAIMGNIYFISLETTTSFANGKISGMVESALQTVTGSDLSPTERASSWIDLINGAPLVRVRIYKRDPDQHGSELVTYQRHHSGPGINDILRISYNKFRVMWPLKDQRYIQGFQESLLVTYLVRFTSMREPDSGGTVNGQQDFDICMYWFDIAAKSGSKPDEKKQVEGLAKVLTQIFSTQPKSRWVTDPTEMSVESNLMIKVK